MVHMTGMMIACRQRLSLRSWIDGNPTISDNRSRVFATRPRERRGNLIKCVYSLLPLTPHCERERKFSFFSPFFLLTKLQKFLLFSVSFLFSKVFFQKLDIVEVKEEEEKGKRKSSNTSMSSDVRVQTEKYM